MEDVLKLAALLYYKEAPALKEGEERTQFEALTEEARKPWVGKAVAIFGMLDKMGKRVVSIASQEEEKAKREKNIGTLKAIIGTFVKTLKHPKGVDKIFPIDELAIRIYDGKVS